MIVTTSHEYIYGSGGGDASMAKSPQTAKTRRSTIYALMQTWYVYQVTSYEAKVVSMRGDHIDQWDKVLVWVTVGSRDGEPFTVTGKYIVESRPSLVCCMCSGVQAGTVPAERVGVAGAQTALKRRRGIS